jgi:hypothetical protein
VLRQRAKAAMVVVNEGGMTMKTFKQIAAEYAPYHIMRSFVCGLKAVSGVADSVALTIGIVVVMA